MMKMLATKIAVLGILVAFGLAAMNLPAYAENGANGFPTNSNIIASGYNPDAQIQGKTYPFVPATNTPSTTVLSLVNIGLLPHFGVNGRPNISISARFSASTGTCAVRYVALYRPNPTAAYTLLGVGPVTTISLDNAPPTDPAGLYIAPTVLQDSYGATDGTLLIVSAPPSGTVTVGMGSY